MPDNSDNYNFIKTKIEGLKDEFPSLRNKSDDYVFSVLAIKSNLYKNPALSFEESDISKIIVDGCNDGGVDALLTDPNSDGSNLVLVQSKFYQSISYDEVVNAVTKMVSFYKDMTQGDYGSVQDKNVPFMGRIYENFSI